MKGTQAPPFPRKAEVVVEKRRKIGSESEARRCRSAVERSGLSIKVWARARGFDGRSLHAWKMNLERRSPPTRRSRSAKAKAIITRSIPSTTQLVELVPAASASSSRYVLRVGSASLEFDDDFTTDSLRRVVDVLRTC